MRVALIAESFLPHMNGVTGSVLQVLQHLERAGHETLVIAPQAPPAGGRGATSAPLLPAGVERTIERAQLLRSLPLPSYPQVRVVFARAARLRAILAEFAPDVVHLASPFVLGWQGVVAADALRLPTVAVYQTDIVAYARRYGLPRATALAASHTARLHSRATVTLAPSRASMQQLSELGVDRVDLWGRGVDGERFAPIRRSSAWRERVAPGKRIIGYVGRLAPEKQVDDLRALADIPGTHVVVVGDGPSRPELKRAMPDALFLGHLTGTALAEAVASFDVFVHPGESETFGQTLQEALASGVPVVATGRGGPIDIVRSSIDGWLYRPGDLAEMRARVVDLLGDETKRAAFGQAARAGVEPRTWSAVCSALVQHYERAIALRRLDDASPRHPRRAALPAVRTSAADWGSYVALGDSLTEGLCDTSRMPPGEYRGWADRLSVMLAAVTSSPDGFRYANLAVRSRRIRGLGDEQVPAALGLAPRLVSVFMGANDLVRPSVDGEALADDLAAQVRRLREAGSDVLLVTPFLPHRTAASPLRRRFAAFAERVRAIADEHDCMLLDLATDAEIAAPEMFADDKVHLSSRGHRFVAYRAARVLGGPDAERLGALDHALHSDEEHPRSGSWFARDALPWMWRRVRGRTAGDGRLPKHDAYIAVTPLDAPAEAEAPVHEGSLGLR